MRRHAAPRRHGRCARRRATGGPALARPTLLVSALVAALSGCCHRDGRGGWTAVVAASDALPLSAAGKTVLSLGRVSSDRVRAGVYHNGDTVGAHASPVHASPPLRASELYVPRMHGGAQASRHAHGRRVDPIRRLASAGARLNLSGWTELVLRHDYGWWDGDRRRRAGHTHTRSFVVHRPVVLRCDPAAPAFDFAYAPRVESGVARAGARGPRLVPPSPPGARAVLPSPMFGVSIAGMFSGVALLPHNARACPDDALGECGHHHHQQNHQAHHLSRDHTREQDAGPSSRGAPADTTAPPLPKVVVLFERRHFTNHLHYGSVRWAVHALTLCTKAAGLAGLTLRDVDCFPVSVGAERVPTLRGPKDGVAHDDELGGLLPLEREWPQLRDFQRKVFGRAFAAPCGGIEGEKVLAVAFGESVTPLYNFPALSERSLLAGAFGRNLTDADRSALQSCARGDAVVASGVLTDKQRCDHVTDPVVKDILSHRLCHGHSTELPRFPELRQPMAALRARVGAAAAGLAKVGRRVVLFQRNGCPFPDRFGRDNDLWRTRFAAPQKHRCLLNVAEMETALAAAGFDIDVVDWGSREYRNHSRVVEAVRDADVFVGVEGSGSLQALWMPQGRSGFLQLHPHRWGADRAWGSDTVDLYTEAWLHYTGHCVHNWRLSDIHDTPVGAALIVGAVRQLHGRLADGTCRTCLVNSETGLCERLDEFN